MAEDATIVSVLRPQMERRAGLKFEASRGIKNPESAYHFNFHGVFVAGVSRLEPIKG
jgi:hypothetical protein